MTIQKLTPNMMGCNAKVKLPQLYRMQQIVNSNGCDFSVYPLGEYDIITSIDRIGRNLTDLCLFAEMAIEHAFRDILVAQANPTGADICFEFGIDMCNESDIDTIVKSTLLYCEKFGIQIGKLHSVLSQQTHITVAARGLRPASRDKKKISSGKVFLVGLLGISKLNSLREFEENSVPSPHNFMRIDTIKPLLFRIRDELSDVSDVSGYGLAGALSNLAQRHRVGMEIELKPQLLSHRSAIDIPFDCHQTDYDETCIDFLSTQAMKIATLREVAGPLVLLVENTSRESFIKNIEDEYGCCFSEIGHYDNAKSGVRIK